MQNLVAGCIVVFGFPLAVCCYFAFRVLRWGFWPTTIGGAALISLYVAARSFYEALAIPLADLFTEAMFDSLTGFPFYLAIVAIVSWATKTTFFKEKKEDEA